MRPRASTIVWGGIILLIGVLVLSVNLGGLLRWPDLDPVAVVVGLIGGLGALLVVCAIIGSIVSAARERRAERSVTTAAATPDAAERDTVGDAADTLRLG